MAEPTFAPVQVIRSWDETPLLRAIEIDLGAARSAHSVPGQVIRARAPGGADGYFALANAPSEKASQLLVKRGAPVADALIAAGLSGSPLEATPPFGKGFPMGEALGKDLLLFANGSGITPIRAVVDEIISKRAQFGKVMLFYGQRHEADFAYRREHKDWETAGVEVTLCASQPHADWSGARGYVQSVAAEKFHGTPEKTVAFICGVKAMVAAVHEMLAAKGITRERAFLNF